MIMKPHSFRVCLLLLTLLVALGQCQVDLDQWFNATCEVPEEEDTYFKFVANNGTYECDLTEPNHNLTCVDEMIESKALLERCTGTLHDENGSHIITFSCLINWDYEGSVCCMVAGRLTHCDYFPKPRSLPSESSSVLVTPTNSSTVSLSTTPTVSPPLTSIYPTGPSTARHGGQGGIAIGIILFIVIVVVVLVVICLIVCLRRRGRKDTTDVDNNDVRRTPTPDVDPPGGVQCGPPPPPCPSDEDSSDSSESGTMPPEDFLDNLQEHKSGSSYIEAPRSLSLQSSGKPSLGPSGLRHRPIKSEEETTDAVDRSHTSLHELFSVREDRTLQASTVRGFKTLAGHEEWTHSEPVWQSST